MSHSSGRRAQVEPFAAIVAVFAVGIGLTVYAGALDANLPGERERNRADPTLDRVVTQVSEAGVVNPDQIDAATTVTPAGAEVNATLVAAGQRWHVGPAPPATADVASQRVSVRVHPGQVRPGRLEVAVW